MKLTPEVIQHLKNNLHTLRPAQKEEVLGLLEEIETRKIKKLAKTSLLEFVRRIDPTYKVGAHHRKLAALLEDIAIGKKDRVAVNMAPRFGKSTLVSYYFPAWFLGNYPDKKVMIVSHTADLAVDFGRKVRNLIASPAYSAIFPDVSLSQDSKSAGRWHTNHAGEFFAAGVGGAIAGRGADLLLCDDPHNERDLVNGNMDAFDKAYEWFTTGARTRLMPGGRCAIVHTRWALNDLTGRLTKDMVMNEGSDQYEIVEFPAVIEREEPIEGDTEGGTHFVQYSLWPEQWSLEELLRTKASMPASQWNAQYQQNPTSEEGAIVKREWWRCWEDDIPPRCDFIIQSWDTAFEKHNRADYSACTTWGVWWPERDPYDNPNGNANIILLDAFRDRMEFPELKKVALERFREWDTPNTPVALIVEKKASGAPLIYELRAMGIIVQEYTPSKGHDKISRLNSVSDMFASGIVWAPRTRWAEELIDEVAAFPAGEHDDRVDATTLALMRFRQGGFIRLALDEKDPPKQFKSKRRMGYY